MRPDPKLFYFNCSNLSPGDKVHHLESTSFVNLNYIPRERTDSPSTMLRDQREQETNMFLRLRTNRTQQDRIRPVVDNGTKIVDLMKVIHQQNQKAELSRVSCAVEMRTSWERGGRRSEPRMTRQ